MSLADAKTIVECLQSLPAGQERGFHFRSTEGHESFYAYEDLLRHAEDRAARLLASGLSQGDRLGVVIPEPAEFALTFLGAVVAGIIPVPIYPRASFKAKNSYVETVRHILDAAQAKAVVTLEATLPAISDANSAPGQRRFLILEKLLAAAAPQTFSPPTIRPADVCFLQFTSGSTSLPKGVVVTHQNLVANARDFLGPHGCDRRPEDIGLTWLPLYHDMGLIGFMLATLVCDIPTHFIPTESFARRPSLWMEAVHRTRASILFAPNFGYALAAKRARASDLADLDLSCIRLAGCGAEPINPLVMRDFAERFAPAGFNPSALMPCYGMAEATLAVSFSPHGQGVRTDLVDTAALRSGRALKSTSPELATELVSCGLPFPSSPVRIVDAAGQSLPDRTVGEVVVRGPGVTGGYFENPQASAESFRDGELFTGDLGYLADGHLYICGRKKDLIIIRGANIHPQDVEWSVAEIEGIRRDNVVAFSIMVHGEEQLAIAAECNSGQAAELRTTIPREVAERHGLRVEHLALVRVGSLPKTSSGKAQRRRTRELFEAGQLELHPEV